MKDIINRIISTISLPNGRVGVGLLLLAITSLAAHAQVFDVTITPTDGSDVFSKTSATSIEIKPGDESPIHVFSGDSDTEGESLTVAHGVRYDFALTPVTTINSGSGNLPEGNFPAQAPKRKAVEAPSFTEPALTGPALVIMREEYDPIIYYAEDATEGSIKLKCNPNGDYMVENTVVDKVIAVFYKDAHTPEAHAAVKATCTKAGNTAYWSCSHDKCDKYFSDEACTEEIEEDSWVIPATGHDFPTDYTNGIKECSRCHEKEYESATQVTAENYESLGFTADNYTAFVDYYAIGNAGQLYWFATNACDKSAVLTADIVVNENVLKENFSLNGDGSNFRPWTPIVELSIGKTFDGNGHTVSGLYYSGNDMNVGLVRCNYGTIKNIGVKDSYLNTSTSNAFYVGGVCGNNNGTIINCYATNLTASGYCAGGICGLNKKDVIDATITNCYATNVSTPVDYVSGVCGYNDNGTISNCYATKVTASIGACGVCILNEGTITNCYATSITGGYQSVGACAINRGTITNCYTDYKNPIGTSNQTAIKTAVETKSAQAFANGEVCWLLNGRVVNGTWSAGTGTPVWYQKLGDDGDSYPVLKKASNGSNTVYYGYECESDEPTYANRELYANANTHHVDAAPDGYCDVCGKGVDVKVALSKVGDRYYTSFGAPYIYNVTNAGDDLKVYVATSLSDGVLTMAQAGDAAIPAGKGVVIVGTSSSSPETMTATIASAEEADVESDLLGATTAGMETAGNAFFSAVNGIVGFYAYNTTLGAVPAGKAYLELPTEEDDAKGFTMVFEDETTGISLTPALSQGEGVFKYLENGKVVIVRNGKKFNVNGQEVK